MSANAPHPPSRPSDCYPGVVGTRPRMLHENVETWTDCCSCEAEPRWQALADESERAAGPAAAPAGGTPPARRTEQP